MNNFSVIYKILKILERAMDYDELDMEEMSAQNLKISENRLLRIWEMLSREGYVDGITVKYGAQGSVTVSVSTPRITLKGLEYLAGNSFMKKAANIAKGIKEITPRF